MRTWELGTGVFLVVALGWAQDGVDRKTLLGVWTVNESSNEETWSLESKGDVLDVTRSDEGKVTLEMKCIPTGKDCAGSDEGKKISVSAYFNGPALVEMETKDSYVTLRKFYIEGGMDRMTIEVNPVTGPGKAYKLHLARRVEANAR